MASIPHLLLYSIVLLLIGCAVLAINRKWAKDSSVHTFSIQIIIIGSMFSVFTGMLIFIEIISYIIKHNP